MPLQVNGYQERDYDQLTPESPVMSLFLARLNRLCNSGEKNYFLDRIDTTFGLRWF